MTQPLTEEDDMAEPLLLDEFLPTFDHVVSVSQVLRAPPEKVFEAATNLDLYRLPLVHLLIAARGLPARLADARARRRGESVAAEPPTFRVRDLPARGWILLGEWPGTELVLGTVTKPWQPLGGEPERPVTADSFAGFAEPGFAKLAETTRVTPFGAQACILTLETRVVSTDEASRRRFQRYWRATGPFIGLIRPAVMRALDRQLGRSPSPSPG
ncbi:hypothetical protein B4U45_21075 [Mycobacterium persicum]|uniref:DUF2867 domain-containing protein n=2 Tax=Mycobacterium persicum TaxID=1487726 RepID=A0A8E2LRG5_9MYCO|nr:hypothetical protein A4G31_19580 [Mycobacterium persicum]ORB55346.1 hypothetical protein BST40_05840 [Mycobacterium persicum]ORB91258.1 hypothetical protein B1T49_20760 [Mycobacterium persicum]ORB96554.1 hypothetical protein B1T44_20940 [Mycobacterium persicum]ORC08715.1 hypothetical protein B4U45_21075 [Mycobacterium persicum]